MDHVASPIVSARGLPSCAGCSGPCDRPPIRFIARAAAARTWPLLGVWPASCSAIQDNRDSASSRPMPVSAF